jgi:hypothetical protein
MSVTALVVPVLVSAFLVFIASSVVHMVLPLHRNDLKPIPREDEVLDALRRIDMPSGDYVAPRPASMAAMKEPAFIEKVKRGPIVLMTVTPGGSMSMTKNLTLWFVYLVVVGLFTAAVAVDALAPAAAFSRVLCLVAVVSFMGYALALVQQSIWSSRSWFTTFKSMIDGAIYAVVTGVTFAWLWPH